jgi:hypothetical protein
VQVFSGRAFAQCKPKGEWTPELSKAFRLHQLSTPSLQGVNVTDSMPVSLALRPYEEELRSIHHATRAPAPAAQPAADQPAGERRTVKGTTDAAKASAVRASEFAGARLLKIAAATAADGAKYHHVASDVTEVRVSLAVGLSSVLCLPACLCGAAYCRDAPCFDADWCCDGTWFTPTCRLAAACFDATYYCGAV